MFHTKTFVKKRFLSVIITERKNVMQNNIKITSYKRLKNVLCLLGTLSVENVTRTKSHTVVQYFEVSGTKRI